MLEHEEAFAEEAQEEAILAQTPHAEPIINTRFHVRDQDQDDNETSPLMSPRQRRKSPVTYTRARNSYERAINEPWTGAHGSSGLPWYKTPSVCLLTSVWVSKDADVPRYCGCSRPSCPSPSHSAAFWFPKPISYLT
jgi:hypothetical protein